MGDGAETYRGSEAHLTRDVELEIQRRVTLVPWVMQQVQGILP